MIWQSFGRKVWNKWLEHVSWMSLGLCSIAFPIRKLASFWMYLPVLMDDLP